MFQLSHLQELKMEEELLLSASSYARCLNDYIQDAVVSRNQNIMVTETDINNNTETTTIYYEESSYVRAGILEIAEELLDMDYLTSYDGFTEHLITFESYVNESIMPGWTFTISDNDHVVAVKTEEIKNEEKQLQHSI